MDSLVGEERGHQLIRTEANPLHAVVWLLIGIWGGDMCLFMHASQNADNDKAPAAAIVELEAIKPPHNLVGLLQGWWITSRPSIPTIR